MLHSICYLNLHVGNLSILWDLHFTSPELWRALSSSKSMTCNVNTAE